MIFENFGVIDFLRQGDDMSSYTPTLSLLYKRRFTAPTVIKRYLYYIFSFFSSSICSLECACVKENIEMK